MPVIFHPPVEQIEANFFGPVTLSNRRFIRILKKLGDGFEVYYQPRIGDDRPDFAVVRQGRGVQLIKTCALDLSELTVMENGDYLKTSTAATYASPFILLNRTQESLSESFLFPIFRLENPELPDFIALSKRQKFYICVRKAVYFDSSFKEFESLYAGRDYHINIFSSRVKKFEHYSLFWTKEDTDSLILNQIQYNFAQGKSSDEIVFTEDMAEALRRQFLSWDRDEIYYAIEPQGQQKKLVESTPGERHRIKGSAGSGKTTVLATRAINCHALTKEPVLILYYNITLGSFLKDKIFQQGHTLSGYAFPRDSLNNCFEFCNFDSFIYSKARKLGIPFARVSRDAHLSKKEWDKRKELLIEKIREQMAAHNLDGTDGEFKYKTILIDELQDFTYNKKRPDLSWIRLIQDCFLKKDGELVVFADASQTLYDGKPMDKDKHPYTPGFSGNWNTLTANYRLSTVTADVAQKFQSRFFEKDTFDKISLTSKKTGLGGFGFADPKIKGRSYTPNFFMNCFQWFVGKYNINTNDVAILASDVTTLQLLDQEVSKNFKHFPVLRTFATEKERQKAIVQVRDEFEATHKKNPRAVWDEKDPQIKSRIKERIQDYSRHQKTLFMINHPHTNAIKLSTIHSFKGQESNTVILLLTNALMESAHSASLIYTALSRAKQNLVVFDATDASPANPWYSTYERYKHFFEEMDTYFKNT